MDNSLDYLPQMFALLEPRAFPLSKQRLNRVRRREQSQRPGTEAGGGDAAGPQACSHAAAQGARLPGGRRGQRGLRGCGGHSVRSAGGPRRGVQGGQGRGSQAVGAVTPTGAPPCASGHATALVRTPPPLGSAGASGLPGPGVLPPLPTPQQRDSTHHLSSNLGL